MGKKSLVLAALLGLLWASVAQAQTTANVTHSSVSIGDSSTSVTTRTTRRLIFFQNYSDAVIYCKFNAVAVAGEGMVLNPRGADTQAGGAFFFDVVVPTGALNCISTDASKTLLLGEAP